MQRLQQQLEMSQRSSPKTAAAPKPTSQQPTSKPNPTKPAATKKTKTPAVGKYTTTDLISLPLLCSIRTYSTCLLCLLTEAASSSTPLRKIQESSDFSVQLKNGDSFKRKPRVAHQNKTSTSPGKTPSQSLLSPPSFGTNNRRKEQDRYK